MLTEVAYQKTERADTDDVILPENCSKEKFTMVVEDNIDRLEETLSGNLKSLTLYFFYIYVSVHL